ncbi:hypothetical protein ACA910_022260 [Epithemia clementina (nom. ined.)]
MTLTTETAEMEQSTKVLVRKMKDGNDMAADQDDDDYNNDDDDDDDDEYYKDWFQSIRSRTGLEIGIRVTWPNVRPFSISTILDSSEMAPLFHGTQWAGTRIWSAAVVALQYLLLHTKKPKTISSNNNTNNNNSINDDDDDDDGSALNGIKLVPVSLSSGEESSSTQGDLSSNNTTNPHPKNGQTKSFQIGPETTVLELGCGLGVPGILLHEITSCSVVLTDKESLVEQLKDNLNHVFPVTSSSSSSSSNTTNATELGRQDHHGHDKNNNNNNNNNNTVEARALDWSAEGVQNLLEKSVVVTSKAATATRTKQSTTKSTTTITTTTTIGDVPGAPCRRSPFDIVLNCDCVYEPLYGRAAWQSLIACQRALLEANPQTILITSLERRSSDGVEQYLDALVTQVAQTVERVENLPFAHDPKIEIYQAYGLRKNPTRRPPPRRRMAN